MALERQSKGNAGAMGNVPALGWGGAGGNFPDLL